MHRGKSCLIIRNLHRLDGYPSNSFLTLLICLQCSDNDFGVGVVTRDILYEPEKNNQVFYVNLFKIFFRHTKRNEKNVVGSE